MFCVLFCFLSAAFVPSSSFLIPLRLFDNQLGSLDETPCTSPTVIPTNRYKKNIDPRLNIP
jgi:hypothetical protein